MEGSEHVGGNIYINPDAPLAEHAKVYKGRSLKNDQESKEVAVKLFCIPSEEDAKPMIAEAQTIKHKPHENIVKFVEASFSTKFLCMYLAMEMCRNVNLHDQVIAMRKKRRKYSFKDCMSVAKQLGAALEHLRRNEIFHRDIKPSNVLFSQDGRILKLTDFSLLKAHRPGRTVTADSFKRIGTDGWRAPEVYERNMHTYGSDMYSLGLLLYFVWSNGEHAFGNELDLQSYNIKKNINLDISKICFENPKEARNVLEMMLEFEEQRRITAEDFCGTSLCKNASGQIENLEGEEYPLNLSSAAESKLSKCPSIAVFDRKTKSLQAFNPSLRTWRHMQGTHGDMISTSMAMVCSNGRIYILLAEKKVFCIRYQDGHAEWEILDDMELDHGDIPPVTVLDGYIYAIGECKLKPHEPQRGERLDLSTRKWSEVPNMKTSRTMLSVVGCNGLVYSIGGKNCDETHKDQPDEADDRGEKFDPCTGEWSSIARMGKPRYGASATALKDKIYVLGGARSNEGSLRDAEVYDTKADGWTWLAQMSFSRCYLGAVTVHEKVYAVNGYNISPLTIEEYDPDSDKWEVVNEKANMTLLPSACAIGFCADAC